MASNTSVLVAVDGSPAADRATAHAVGLASASAGTVIHLLNVQPSVDGLVTMFVSQAIVDSYHREEGGKALVSAARICAEAGIPFQEHIGVGRPGEVIACFARRLDAGLVVSGTRGHGGVVGVLLGSVAQDILARVDVPITFVK